MGTQESVHPMNPVLTLTEEELLVLTGGHLGVVPARLQLPQDAESAALVDAVATRTLMARGLILPRGAGQEGAAWEATEPLGITLSLRELAPVVLGLQRVLGPLPGATGPGGGDAASGATAAHDEVGGRSKEAAPHEDGSTVAVRYLHLHREVAVIEDVTPEGMHSLLSVFPDSYVDAVADFIRPPEAVPGEGAVRTGRREKGPSGLSPAAVADLLAALEHPTVLVEALIQPIARDGEPPLEAAGQMLALGPGGTFRSTDSLRYEPVDPDEAIRDLIEQVLAHAG